MEATGSSPMPLLHHCGAINHPEAQGAGCQCNDKGLPTSVLMIVRLETPKRWPCNVGGCVLSAFLSPQSCGMPEQ